MGISTVKSGWFTSDNIDEKISISRLLKKNKGSWKFLKEKLKIEE